MTLLFIMVVPGMPIVSLYVKVCLYQYKSKLLFNENEGF